MSTPFCTRHSFELEAALKRKGLGKLIKWKSAEDVTRFTVRWLAGVATREEFDSYIVSSLEIMGKAHQFGFNPHICSLCEVCARLLKIDADDEWIDNVTDLMVLVAHVNHLKIG